jgi:hypothetical protein
VAIFRKDNMEFQLIDYSATHNQLLIRNFKTKDRNYNIDIIIKGVNSLLISTTMKGINISLLKDKNKEKFLVDEYKFNIEYDNRIFLIDDSLGNSHYINALCFGVYHNDLDILETSIGRYDFENHGELVLWFAD